MSILATTQYENPHVSSFDQPILDIDAGSTVNVPSKMSLHNNIRQSLIVLTFLPPAHSIYYEFDLFLGDSR